MDGRPRSRTARQWVYTLMVHDADRVATWLQTQGIQAAAYHAGKTDDARQTLEAALLGNEIKCLVATTALGMGYDKPDLGFVIHYQAPGSVVTYYQQVGRAGRAIEKAFGLLLSGDEEDDINAYFRKTAFPPEWQITQLLATLDACTTDGMTTRSLERTTNLRLSQIEKALTLLVVEETAPVVKIGSKWHRTAQPFSVSRERILHLTTQREHEWAQMKIYIAAKQCLMQFLAAALDDPLAKPCGQCAVCEGAPIISPVISSARRMAAQRFTQQSERPLVLKKQWDISALPQYARQFSWHRTNIPLHLRGEMGQILSHWGEPGWGEMVAKGKAKGRFADDLVDASAELIRKRWRMYPPPVWVTCIPSDRHPMLVPDFAQRLATAIGLPFHPVLIKALQTHAQKDMENRYHQCRNLDGTLTVDASVPEFAAPVLLVDDIFDSGWTLTLATAVLRQAGSGPVYPYALAVTTAK